MMARRSSRQGEDNLPVSEVMQSKPITVPPHTPTLEAIKVMKKHRIGCLPIVEDERLVGIVTERDFMDVAGQLMEDLLKE